MGRVQAKASAAIQTAMATSLSPPKIRVMMKANAPTPPIKSRAMKPNMNTIRKNNTRGRCLG